MATHEVERKVITLVNNKWWDGVQEDLQEAIEDLDKIINALKRLQPQADAGTEILREYMEGKAQKVRGLLENMQTPL